MEVILKSKTGSHYAKGIYLNGTIVILSGSKISLTDAYSRMPASVQELRRDKTLVDQEGITKKDISFPNPTAAAQFVTGRSVNGYIAWRPDDKMSLKEYMSKKAD